MGRFEGIPGRVEVKMEIVPAGDAREGDTSRWAADYAADARGTPAARRGRRTPNPGPEGAVHRISLKQYAHLDPHTTHLLISDTFYPDHPFRKQDEPALQDPDFDKHIRP